DLDAEVRELQLDEPRHLLEVLGRVAAFSRRRLVEERKRRQLAGRDRLEQRHLTLALDPHALLDLADRRLDARHDLRLRPGTRLRDQLVPMLLRAAALEKDADPPERSVEHAEARIDRAPDAVHDCEP